MNASLRNKVGWLMLIIVLLLPMIAMADPLSTAPSGKQLAENATDTANSIAIFVQAAVCLAGLISVCAGLYGFIRVNKEKGQGQHSINGSLVACGVGVALILLPLTVGTLGKSLFGDDMARPQRIEISPN